MQVGKKHIVVLGAGFAGLTFCQHFRHTDAYVTLVDRQNHHLFQPLLYQVASAGLSVPEIAQPIRSILSKKTNLTVLMDHVIAVDLAARLVVMENNRLNYDYLVLALGSVTSYFGHPEWEQFAPGLKTVDDALRIRRNVLLAFERAEAENNPKRREQLLTIVVVGGGPTGVELAGSFAELRRHVLARDFDHIDPTTARVILIEGSQWILGNFGERLAKCAQRQLQNLGVEIRTGAHVRNVSSRCVELHTGETIFAENIIWAAGVAASPIAKALGVEMDRAGRVKVQSDLSIPGHPEAFVAGDMARVTSRDGSPVPGLAPAAMQMTRHIARTIEAELSSPGLNPRKRFQYFDKGTMATIGRSAGVAKIRKLEFSGLLAWLAWLFVHLIFIVGLRNKIAVFFSWVYSYTTYKRGARIITGLSDSAAPTSFGDHP